MATRTLPNADPLVADKERTATDMDMAEHIRTYAGFLQLTKWFLIHAALILVAIYSFVIAHNGWLGFLFLILGIVALIHGLTRQPAVRRDVAAASADHEA